MRSVKSSGFPSKCFDRAEQTTPRGNQKNTTGVVFLPTLYLEDDNFSVSEVELGGTYYALQEGMAN